MTRFTLLAIFALLSIFAGFSAGFSVDGGENGNGSNGKCCARDALAAAGLKPALRGRGKRQTAAGFVHLSATVSVQEV